MARERGRTTGRRGQTSIWATVVRFEPYEAYAWPSECQLIGSTKGLRGVEPTRLRQAKVLGRYRLTWTFRWHRIERPIRRRRHDL
jgi:hypothetical protein